MKRPQAIIAAALIGILGGCGGPADAPLAEADAALKKAQTEHVIETVTETTEKLSDVR